MYVYMLVLCIKMAGRQADTTDVFVFVAAAAGDQYLSLELVFEQWKHTMNRKSTNFGADFVLRTIIELQSSSARIW